MKKILILTLLLIGYLSSYSQLTELPTGSKPFSTQVWIAPNGDLYTGVDGVYLLISSTGGSLTSVGLSAPTGFSVSNSPITSSGTLALTYSTGYQGYTTTEANKLAGIASNANNYTLPWMTRDIIGGARLFSDDTAMETVNPITTVEGRTYGLQLNSQGRLVVNVPWTSGGGGGDTYFGSTSVVLNGTSFERAALTGDVTAAQNSNTLTIANNAVTTAKITNSAVTLAKIQNIPTKTLIGRYSTGTGVPQSITIGSGLNLNSSTGELTATGGGGNTTGTTSTTINMAGPRFQRLGARSSNTTLTLSNNTDGAEVQVSLNNTAGSTITVSVSGANAVSDILVPPGSTAVVSISNFGGGQTLYAVTAN